MTPLLLVTLSALAPAMIVGGLLLALIGRRA